MRNINFIRPIPEYRQKELSRWALGSTILVLSSIIAISCISFIQWRVYRTISKEKYDLSQQLASYDQIMAQQRSQSQEETNLLAKLGKLQEYTNHPKNPIDIITTVQKTLGSAPLQSLSIGNNHFELKGGCSNAKYATQLVQKLNAMPQYKQAQLHSLNSSTNSSLQFVIKGSLG
jgi:hypothetical protein